jgi:CheY-like chemotaxis protein/HPt (histidine-containing phosphotransfer) domain-containing protein
VLVVDDFPSNLLVAEGLLAPYAVRVTTCLNGREAVELVRSRPFDLVLMDHMMPEMDGVEATAIIRAMDGRCRATPIVALTANAVSGMREMFLESGFDDFISKPIDTAKLDEALSQWIPEAKRRKAGDGWAAPESPPSTDTAEPAVSAKLAASPEPRLPVIADVDSSAGLARVGGSPGRYLDLLDLFCRDAASVAPLLEAVPDGASLPAFTTTVHALKSALANIGAERLSQAAADLERAGREADLPLIVRGLPAFREDLATLTIRIRQGAREAPGPPGGDGDGRDRPEIAAASAELRKALEARDLDAVDAALERLRESAPAGQARQAVSEIADFILTADFQQALEALAALSGGTA